MAIEIIPDWMANLDHEDVIITFKLKSSFWPPVP